MTQVHDDAHDPRRGGARRLRVLFVTRQYPPHGVGGIGTYVELLARLLTARGHEVTVLSAAPAHSGSTEVTDGVRIVRTPVVGPEWLWRRLFQKSWVVASRLQAALSARSGLRRLGEHFDVIEAPEWKAEGLLLQRCRRGPVVIHLHLPYELVRRWDRRPLRRWRGEQMAEWLERRTALASAAITATSQLSRLGPEGQRWLPDRAVAIVPPPLVVEEWSACAPIEATGPVVLFIGHLERRKAPEVLLDALSLVADEVDGLRVVFIGRPFAGPGGVPYDEYLRARAGRLGVSFEHLAPQSGAAAMLAQYGQARVVAVPSRYETLSMVALEGLACGRPVLMTAAVGATEWVADAIPELVVPVDDVRAMADALRPLLLDVTEAKRLGERGRDALTKACSPDSIVNERIAVYEAVGTR